MKASAILERAKGREALVVQNLYPNLDLSGATAQMGSINGEAGRSFVITLTGPKAGCWYENGADKPGGEENGDLIGLVRHRLGCDIGEAKRHIMQILGIKDDVAADFANRDRAAKAFSDTLASKAGKQAEPVAPTLKIEKPVAKAMPEGFSPITETSPAMKFFEGRGIGVETVAAYRIHYNQARDEVLFPIFNEQGIYIGGKTRALKEKRFSQPGGGAHYLFGLDQCIGSDVLIITEGEMDAMAIHAALGVPACSIPMGAGANEGKQKWIHNNFDIIEDAEKIIIWMDNDENGAPTADYLARRLGIERCFIVKSHEKDANDLLKSGGPEAIIEAIRASDTINPEYLSYAHDYFDEVLEEIYPSAERRQHPFALLGDGGNQDVFFGPGEVTLVTGWTGHGKTTFLSQLSAGLLLQNKRVCAFSGEFKVHKSLATMYRQIAGKNQPSIDDLEKISRFVHQRYMLFNRLGRAKVGELLEVFKYVYKRFGCEFFIIDSLMMCDITLKDDVDVHKEVMHEFVEFAKTHNVHLFVVAHPRKPGKEGEKMAADNYQILGSSMIPNLCDNIISVVRNVDEEKGLGDPDGFFVVGKTREMDKVAHQKIGYYIDLPSRQISFEYQAQPSDLVGMLLNCDARRGDQA